MQLLGYIIAYPLLWLVSRLPFRLLYLLSDGVYFLVYRVFGYRKKVVRGNLKLVFPEKSQKEILSIEKKFYRHLCDMFLEMIKTMNMTNEKMLGRFHVTNPELINGYAANNQSAVLLAGHYASWEWLLGINTKLAPKAIAIYQKVNNKYFDNLVKRIREKFGTTLIRTNESREIIAKMADKQQTFVLGIASDQSPMLNRQRHWAEFMGIKVPIHVGGEQLCKAHNLIPIFLRVRKLKRGHYEASFEVLFENPQKIPDYEISEAFMDKLEECIREAPEYYFWTHKRWKHRDKIPAELQKAKA
ncbi:lipid A biosynthesis acyltransferase [Allomuricauda sp. d1]|uniref:lysophospholipid acyltransferase family protein n=1 Tax=Allomuricauda sp. d1 TaxID=3136725 RepID=UPI0031DB3FAF